MATAAGARTTSRRVVVALAAAVLTALVAAPAAGAAQVPCAVPAIAYLLNVQAGVPFDRTVGRIECLPAGETLSSVMIDWADGQISPGSVTYTSGGGYETALIGGRHTYATATCRPGRMPCPNGHSIGISAVTDSDGAAVRGYGYMIVVTAPAPVDPQLALAAHVGRSARRLAILLGAKHDIAVALTATIRGAGGRPARTVHRRARVRDGHARVELRLPRAARRVRVSATFRGSGAYAAAHVVEVVRVPRHRRR